MKKFIAILVSVIFTLTMFCACDTNETDTPIGDVVSEVSVSTSEDITIEETTFEDTTIEESTSEDTTIEESSSEDVTSEDEETTSVEETTEEVSIVPVG